MPQRKYTSITQIQGSTFHRVETKLLFILIQPFISSNGFPIGILLMLMNNTALVAIIQALVKT